MEKVVIASAKPQIFVVRSRVFPKREAQAGKKGTVTKVEAALGKSRFNQESKLPKLLQMMEQHFDFPAVYRGLGLAS